MSTIYGKWKREDIRAIIKSLDEKTGMHGATLPICLSKSINQGNTLGAYCPSKNGDRSWCHFEFSLNYFNDEIFKDLAAVDVIRHEYCHFVVDVLGLHEVFNDKDPHGKAWKTICGLLYTDPYGTYREGLFRNTTEDTLLRMTMAEDIPKVDIMEQINRWGTDLPSLYRRKWMGKKLIKKYTKLRVFAVRDTVIHDFCGRGVVLDTMPEENKQMLYVLFDNGNQRIVQNRQVYKIVNGQVKKPLAKAS